MRKDYNKVDSNEVGRKVVAYLLLRDDQENCLCITVFQ